MGQITRRDLESIGAIKVVRYKTPDIRVQTVIRTILRSTFIDISVPIVLGSAIEKKTGNNATKGTVLPDYGELLERDFMLLAPKEINGWPMMVEENNPVDRGYEYKGGALIVFEIDQIYLTFLAGLRVEGYITMRNPNGSKMFDWRFTYTSKHFGLRKSVAKYKADNYKLLIEEIPLAAEHTARELIIDRLKQGL
jgi:hypothetical protein